MPEAAATSTASRRTFGPVVLLGLAGSGFGALAGNRAMLSLPADYLESVGLLGVQGRDGTVVEFPLAGALALVALACWGVLLVTRGIVRRVVAGLSALAALGTLLVLVIGGFLQVDDAAEDLALRLGATAFDDLPLERTGWFWIGLAAAILALAAGLAAVRLVPSWPEMGSRYDAPTRAPRPAPATDPDPAEKSNLDLWKSLDEGSDPTED